jgi:formylmethanofuran dehydrogenase subunit C
MSSKLGAIAAGEVIITGGAEVVATTMVGGIIAVTGDLISDHSDEAASVGGLFLSRQPADEVTAT